MIKQDAKKILQYYDDTSSTTSCVWHANLPNQSINPSIINHCGTLSHTPHNTHKPAHAPPEHTIIVEVLEKNERQVRRIYCYATRKKKSYQLQGSCAANVPGALICRWPHLFSHLMVEHASYPFRDRAPPSKVNK